MTNILLISSEGRSRNILGNRMNQEARKDGLKVKVLAVSMNDIKSRINDADLILLGPQIRYIQSEINKLTHVPVEVIDFTTYGNLEASKVLQNALKILEIV